MKFESKYTNFQACEDVIYEMAAILSVVWPYIYNNMTKPDLMTTVRINLYQNTPREIW